MTNWPPIFFYTVKEFLSLFYFSFYHSTYFLLLDLRTGPDIMMSTNTIYIDITRSFAHLNLFFAELACRGRGLHINLRREFSISICNEYYKTIFNTRYYLL